MSHTPGPWEVVRRGAGKDPANRNIADSQGRQIATAASGFVYLTTAASIACALELEQPEIDANANLIAAAPELLTSIKKLRNEVQNNKHVRLQSDNFVTDFQLGEIFTEIDAAIAKAEGGQP